MTEMCALEKLLVISPFRAWFHRGETSAFIRLGPARWLWQRVTLNKARRWAGEDGGGRRSSVLPLQGMARGATSE